MRKFIVLGITGLILWGCNNSNEKPATNKQEKTHATHHHKESSEAIELNNGEKWVVNEEMKPFVLKGAELVSIYVQENETDYKELAEELKEQNNQLIKSCTMDGKSHDELHKWLHPHLELVKKLENTPDEHTAKEIVLKLQQSNEMYHRYFN